MPKTLEELQAADLPRLDWKEFVTVTADAPDSPEMSDQISKLEEYCKNFLPIGEGKCVSCGRTLGGLLGTFQWGIANGEGFCCSEGCHYPARAIHRNIGAISVLNLILQYHPSTLKRAEEEAAEEQDEPV